MKKSLSKVVKGHMPQKRTEPFWKGPSVDGITQSMMSQYLCCPRRFSVPTIDGLRASGGFNKNLEYGTMWHVCEEALAKSTSVKNGRDAESVFRPPLQEYCRKLMRKYPLAQDEVTKWYEVCKRQFPVYVDYWKKHPDVKNRKPLLQEATFKIPYQLPNGRIVWLRGKFDSVDLIDKGVYLQENKVKGDIDEAQLKRQLTFDLQTMTYLVALSEYPDAVIQDYPIRGVRYNVIRRPLSGGKGSIRPHAEKRTKNTFTPAESMDAYYNRLLNDYILPEPEYWFMRWKSEVTREEIEAFKREFLNPFLEQVAYWYETVAGIEHEFEFDPNCLHYRLPYGIYNVIAEGGTTDFDEYIASGSTVGLEKITTLFPELEEENA